MTCSTCQDNLPLRKKIKNWWELRKLIKKMERTKKGYNG